MYDDETATSSNPDAKKVIFLYTYTHRFFQSTEISGTLFPKDTAKIKGPLPASDSENVLDLISGFVTAH
ncbi:uncharacterized protein N7511_011350 [Penicillium nucicola]|uniref:uncharacterized protein n=1 Tax=Penicillium nucicola TaxID=1850975 RepID=UPI002544E28E|nr:uncharacterized protein N7511_011350 [Penicillium nucicola]KAJ5742618.1 hypothetical protein N7511_011350 [Penicillium nucicola]